MILLYHMHPIWRRTVLAKKKVKVNRIVYINAALDQRMKRTSEVNWSAVATEAFRQKLQAIRVSKRMAEAIDRLRAAQQAERGSDYETGVALGEDWARDVATPRQLRRLERYVGRSGGVPAWEAGTDTAVAEQAASLAAAIEGNHQVDARAFWQTAIGRAIAADDGELMEGFLDGALQLWSEVKPHL